MVHSSGSGCYLRQYLMRVAMSMRVAVSYESGDEFDSCSIL